MSVGRGGAGSSFLGRHGGFGGNAGRGGWAGRSAMGGGGFGNSFAARHGGGFGNGGMFRGVAGGGNSFVGRHGGFGGQGFANNFGGRGAWRGQGAGWKGGGWNNAGWGGRGGGWNGGWGGRGWGWNGGWGGRGWGWGGGWGGWGFPLYGFGFGGYGLGLGWGGLLGPGLYGLGGYGGWGYGGYGGGYGGGYAYPGYYAYEPYAQAYTVAADSGDYFPGTTNPLTGGGVTATPPGSVPESSTANMGTFAPQAEAAFKNGDYAGAEYALKHAIVDEPQNPVLLMMLGQALFANGKFADAAGATQAAMSGLPKDQWGVVVKNYKELYRSPQDYTNQLRALEKAVGEKPDDPAQRFLLGFHYAYLGYPKESVDQLEKGLKANPTDEAAKQLLNEMKAKLPPPAVPVAPPQPAAPAVSLQPA